jgi:nucleoside triphosphate pyrophosphatase
MKLLNNEKLILASKSPRRQDLLQQVGLNIKISPSHIDESKIKLTSPNEYVKELAFLKANKMSQQYTNHWVLGADTIVVIKDQILGKPKSFDDAINMLKLLRNDCHSVFTAFCIRHKESMNSTIKSVETKVYFKSLSQKEIEWYANTKEPYDKAGGYGIQGIGSFLVKKISGSYSNVVGLPIAEVIDTLTDLNLIEF